MCFHLEYSAAFLSTTLFTYCGDECVLYLQQCTTRVSVLHLQCISKDTLICSSNMQNVVFCSTAWQICTFFNQPFKNKWIQCVLQNVLFIFVKRQIRLFEILAVYMCADGVGRIYVCSKEVKQPSVVSVLVVSRLPSLYLCITICK